ncbi:MAG: serine--tRNA ligase, partial [bacterium]
MLDTNFIRENSKKVKEACENKQVKVDVDEILKLDKKKRELMTNLENLKAEQNKISRAGHDEATINKAKSLKEQFKKIEPEFKE